ncbi:MAG: HAMP domain-containing histidine kinase [Chloroflexota bacterium]|nr:HAMP domain-containing histidine kinase [Chloroflexota bacterium]
MGHKAWRLWPWRHGADPEEAVFARLFRRLLLWYITLLGVMVVLLVLSIGTTVPWLVFVSVEHNLSGPVSQLARAWQAAPHDACPLTRPGQGFMFACYDAQGRLLASRGVKGAAEKHFVENSLALAALREPSAMQDALDETGTEQVRFDLVFFASVRPGIVRQALIVRAVSSNQMLGVIQVGTTPAETLVQRAMIVNIFFASMFLAIVLGVPGGGWYLAGKALQPARLAFQRQRDFIANVSHELGTPLALLRANAEILLRSRALLPPENAELLEDIVEETSYMDRMTSNMLLLARMDASQLHLEREALDLAQIAEGLVRRAQGLAERASITLVFQQEEAAYALGERVLLEQVTLILLDNALKYTQPGGKVGVYTFMEHGCACLRVSDTGIGIVPADLARLGERFYRIDKARSRESGGSGLGLSIACGIVAAHRGELKLSSEPGKGTNATILLPAAPPVHSGI